jgi:hypothetical protein
MKVECRPTARRCMAVVHSNLHACPNSDWILIQPTGEVVSRDYWPRFIQRYHTASKGIKLNLPFLNFSYRVCVFLVNTPLESRAALSTIILTALL